MPYLVAAGMDGSITVKGIRGRCRCPLQRHHRQPGLCRDGPLRYEERALGADFGPVLRRSRGEQRRCSGDRHGGRSADPVRDRRRLPRLARLHPARRCALGGPREPDPVHGRDPRRRRSSAGKSWIDPFVGVHFMAPLAERWWFGARGDVGGFGVGSDLAWQAYADIGFNASKLVIDLPRLSRHRHGL